MFSRILKSSVFDPILQTDIYGIDYKSTLFIDPSLVMNIVHKHATNILGKYQIVPVPLTGTREISKIPRIKDTVTFFNSAEHLTFGIVAQGRQGNVFENGRTGTRAAPGIGVVGI